MPINRNQLYALCARAKVDLQTAQNGLIRPIAPG